MREVKLNNFVGVIFDNGVCVVNTTPHSITMQNTDGTVTSVPSSCIINAKVEEKKVSDLFVTSTFVGDAEGHKAIAEIKSAFAESGIDATLVIVGSIIAAQAYPCDVVGLTPVPGYERVAPSEKMMRCDKFTVFEQ